LPWRDSSRLAGPQQTFLGGIEDIHDIQTVAVNTSIRDLERLKEMHGKGRWRKLKGIARVRLKSGRIRVADCTVLSSWYRQERHEKEAVPGLMQNQRIKKAPPTFVVCIDNSGYLASLELHKIYRVVPDEDAARDGDIRVIDESGEDYLYSADRFIVIEVPKALERSILRAH
jgi:hypothetical protein